MYIIATFLRRMPAAAPSKASKAVAIERADALLENITDYAIA